MGPSYWRIPHPSTCTSYLPYWQEGLSGALNTWDGVRSASTTECSEASQEWSRTAGGLTAPAPALALAPTPAPIPAPAPAPAHSDYNISALHLPGNGSMLDQSINKMVSGWGNTNLISNRWITLAWPFISRAYRSHRGWAASVERTSTARGSWPTGSTPTGSTAATRCSRGGHFHKSKGHKLRDLKITDGGCVIIARAIIYSFALNNKGKKDSVMDERNNYQFTKIYIFNQSLLFTIINLSLSGKNLNVWIEINFKIVFIHTSCSWLFLPIKDYGILYLYPSTRMVLTHKLNLSQTTDWS